LTAGNFNVASSLTVLWIPKYAIETSAKKNPQL